PVGVGGIRIADTMDKQYPIPRRRKRSGTYARSMLGLVRRFIQHTHFTGIHVDEFNAARAAYLRIVVARIVDDPLPVFGKDLGGVYGMALCGKGKLSLFKIYH